MVLEFGEYMIRDLSLADASPIAHRASVFKNGEILDEHLYARLRPGLIEG